MFTLRRTLRTAQYGTISAAFVEASGQPQGQNNAGGRGFPYIATARMFSAARVESCSNCSGLMAQALGTSMSSAPSEAASVRVASCGRFGNGTCA